MKMPCTHQAWQVRLACSAVLAVSAVALVPTAAAGQSLAWSKSPLPGPIARIENSMVWCGGRMVLFGGHDVNFSRMNDLWEYETATKAWTNRTPSPLPAAWPSRRAGQAMACDPAGQPRVFVFGGWTENGDFLNGTFLNDIWEWNTVTNVWTNRTPGGTKPVPRRGAKMVYDAANSRIVMFGGVDHTAWFPNPFPGGTQDKATWVWNLGANTWTAVTTTASSGTGRQFPGRTYHGMVYNTAINRIWVYGGIGIVPGSPGLPIVDLPDIWEFNSATSTWIDRTPAGAAPQPRGWAGVAFDDVSDRMIVHSGWNSTSQSDYPDTWAFNGISWTQLTLTGDGGATIGRDSHAMVFDPSRNKLVIFGGYLADVIEMDPNASTIATALVTTWPPAQDQHSIAYDSDRDKIVMYGGGSFETWELSPSTMTWTLNQWLGPNDRIAHAMAYEAPRRKTILFGGRFKSRGALGATVFSDTWEWDGTAKTWTQRFPGTVPPARYDHAMAFDAARNRVIVFGGRNAAGTALNDTWEWDGSNWASVAAPPGLTPRFGHAMAYDAVRQTVVLFGGDNGSAKFNQTWERRSAPGSGWLLVSSTGPSARAFPAMAPSGDPAGGMLMFGGVTGTATLLNDAWVWNGTTWTPVPGSTPPTARQKAKMVYVPALRRAVLYGGLDANGSSADAYAVSFAPPRRTAGDFDGDGIADLALFRPGNGNWKLRYSTLDFASGPDLAFGLSTDKPVPGDYDGDGRIDVAVYRPSNGIWYVIYSSTGALVQLQWGISTDVPIPADFTGDGRTDLAVWRPSTGVWFIFDLSTGTYTSRQWGVSTDIPLTGDYDGDRKADVVAFRPSNGYWYVFYSSTQTYAVLQWGISTDIPLAADYTGDGRADLAVYRPSTGVWYVYDLSTASYVPYQWGVSTDIPAPKDYDGDGRTDLAIWRPSTGSWLIYYLGTGTFEEILHGASGDIPIK
jgi:N-acetylneuraminic acid mutarotase